MAKLRKAPEHLLNLQLNLLMRTTKLKHSGSKGGFGENFRPQLELDYIERLLKDY